MRRRGYARLPDEGELPSAYIHDVPSRIWHWVNALCIVVLAVTGYLIGTPLPSAAGDTSSLYVMGWIRFAHLATGQVFAVAFLARATWAWAGGGYAGQLFLPAIWRRSWSDGFVEQCRLAVFGSPRPPRYLGLNPAAGSAIFVLFVVPAVIVILTGFGMLAEVKGHGSWTHLAFGWMTTLFGNTLDLHLVHRLCLWALLCFVAMHVVMMVDEDVTGRQSVVSTMLSGWRSFRP
ncbi:hydrogenase 1 cytochrome b subunit [Rhodovastum atsumiense]|uniref:Ni/Fe-hydrogenase, b-type cytochrome subunit n=1 Tax=Rhodovastum atsumiense TaxID=504468 RepID=A0A5M6IWK2_9PROT|nr:Ni/Fe-hydrogenase, b-type cytochrome subunit [Rhodovastum atsumiense]KAA5612704.1 Ni/Fe-hydrogenase, b-type cytochrome subunit [Rhodovastum atsumiense]CAH2602745.1 hydrogenase 1 cytochrome b subunit [Rhodovastum atsumiense]